MTAIIAWIHGGRRIPTGLVPSPRTRGDERCPGTDRLYKLLKILT